MRPRTRRISRRRLLLVGAVAGTATLASGAARGPVASTLVAVTRLVPPNGLIEIEVAAVVPGVGGV
jgi:hypothetical protein